jgi:predicted ATP-grasp superfamily ATP-dependent carboligase
MTNYNIQADILTDRSQGYEEILEQQKFQTQETEENSSLQNEESRVPKND